MARCKQNVDRRIGDWGVRGRTGRIVARYATFRCSRKATHGEYCWQHKRDTEPAPEATERDKGENHG